jgi:hypothetical protein
MIKITYEMNEEGMKKPELTRVNIFPGRLYIQYNVPGKAESVFKKMKEDGRKGVLYSRGAFIQLFPGKNEKEILEIVKKDIENGIYVAEQKTKKKMKIKNMEIEER